MTLGPGFAVLGYAVTPLHPGVGRAPGAVDLPVQRDPMGYPLVYASSLKGALKAECGRRLGKGGPCFDENGRIKCDKNSGCALCCCLFGHEPGSEKEASSLLSVLDLVPLFLPVPSLSHGYLYVTTPYLARRASTILEVVGALQPLKNLLDKISSELTFTEKGSAYTCFEGEAYIATEKLKTRKLGNVDCKDALKAVEELGGLAKDISSRLVVVSDVEGPHYIEKGLIRVTRVRLKLDTKTVATGGLWTEEYIPQGTILLGGLVAVTPKRNHYCSELVKDGRGEAKDGIVTSETAKDLVDRFINALGENKRFYMIVGGKETIGRGLVKFAIHTSTANGKGEK